MKNSGDIRPVKKVVVIGPECTGKSDLCKFLATRFNTTYTEEYAREFLAHLNGPYNQSDLTAIARGQVRLEKEKMLDANRVLICDTNAIVIKVWSEFKYQNCDEEILKLIRENEYDLYLLTFIDIPWVFDPLREHPDKRDELYNIYLNEVSKSGVDFVLIKGPRPQRESIATAAIEKLLSGAE